MKKLIICLCFILSIFSLVSCNKGKVSNDIKIEVSESTKFSKEEIDNAIKCVKDNFSFEGSTLTKIWYDEEKSNHWVDAYLEYGRGLENGAKGENVIVLLSDFDVDGSGDNPVLEPNTTYTDYQWVLIRDNKAGNWKIDDAGY
ncbi:DUF4829 domain-containing protein [Romboutsia sp. 1001216sp1]|uniref:DUF4829 domain-containing protein n=1 Tax=Romboutsia sp. 1001216sp1 TaxID=2986997 RepID=UPI00232E2101|nr:DUF4829 domain-containing protein [Romboutsia sp. 1001216sp1]MDB8804404.1 DUF4829 domain-containing protein [Romboutsia sp. 1001216sp1]MDB8806672.1 DUF4829 domain-containing protein [Romboutsia sp. 1001216sp1]MDB8810052.1 DUF4829 domain-containing protein [Romboutsia sp. 1001216sp1]MDB8815799.1 DUF4829 domain-containing protein [Romboutsia sp. 1001216sp1]MDB8818249.1 DUF4829 domain-containing protein [Romboutsia sp. 1001216sp1]